MSATDHLDKAGVIGATVAALCCLGIPAILSVVSAIGLGFLIRDAILTPLLVLSVALTIFGLARGVRRHHRRWPVAVGAIASIALVVATLAARSRPVAFVSVAVLVVTSVANGILLHRSHT